MNRKAKTTGRRAGKTAERRKVGNSRAANDALRGRKHLTRAEVEKICSAIRKGSRYPVRDECLVRVAFDHGLRVSELIRMRWQHLDLRKQEVHVHRAKGGVSGVHPIFDRRELMLLRKLHGEAGRPVSGFVFINERGAPVSVNAFQKTFAKFSELALGIRWNPHALRHGCGTAMVDKGVHLRTIQRWLGHANVQNTTVYLGTSGRQFRDVEF